MAEHTRTLEGRLNDHLSTCPAIGPTGMNAEHFNLDALLKMRHSPIRNYAVPGLTSWLIGNPSPQGTIRLFESAREQQEAITPHSHRFDFQCWVLRGSVRNRVWSRLSYQSSKSDQYMRSTQTYDGAPGKYKTVRGDIWNWDYQDTVYGPEECYQMQHDQVHSIFFSRGACVLFFEGAAESAESIILEPVENGVVIPTCRVEPWMFQRDAEDSQP